MSKRPKTGSSRPIGFASLVGWLRDRRIGIKLGFIMFVPTLATVIVGANGLVTQISNANTADRARTLATLSADARHAGRLRCRTSAPTRRVCSATGNQHLGRRRRYPTPGRGGQGVPRQVSRSRRRRRRPPTRSRAVATSDVPATLQLAAHRHPAQHRRAARAAHTGRRRTRHRRCTESRAISNTRRSSRRPARASATPPPSSPVTRRSRSRCARPVRSPSAKEYLAAGARRRARGAARRAAMPPGAAQGLHRRRTTGQSQALDAFAVVATPASRTLLDADRHRRRTAPVRRSTKARSTALQPAMAMPTGFTVDQWNAAMASAPNLLRARSRSAARQARSSPTPRPRATDVRAPDHHRRRPALRHRADRHADRLVRGPVDEPIAARAASTARSPSPGTVCRRRSPDCATRRSRRS